MDINDQDIYQGVVFLKALRQVEELSNDLNYKIRSGTSKNSFLIEGEKTRTVGIYVKYTKKPRSPWSFSFIQEHQEEIEVLAEVCNEVLITFVCHYDGIVCLTYKELKEVLDVFPSPKELEFYKLAAEKGNREAQYELGYIYDYGEEGVEQNTKLAIKYYEINWSFDIVFGLVFLYSTRRKNSREI